MRQILSSILITALFSTSIYASGKIQGADVKTEAELIAAGASKAQMIKDSQIYVTANGINDKMSAAISNGLLGGLPSWATATSYTVGQSITYSNNIYKCLIAHTSGVFATDLASGDWVQLAATNVSAATGTLPIANGGTGSTTQNFVDLTNPQTIAGVKTFSSTIVGSINGNAATVTTNANLTGGVTSVGNAATVVTNANLTGPITSVGNATAVAAQTGTGSTFVMNTSPVLVTPNLGTPSAVVLTNATGTAASLTAGHVTTNANLTGDVTSVGNATTLTNAAAIGKVLTGYASAPGTVAATDTILAAFGKLNGNAALVLDPQGGLLVNANFELSAIGASWVTTGATTAIYSTAAGVYRGAQSASITPTATTSPFTLVQDVVTPAGAANTQGNISIYMQVPAVQTNIQFCARQNGAVISGLCVNAINDGVYHNYTIPVLFGSTSTGVQVQSNGNAVSLTPLYVDNAGLNYGLGNGAGSISIDTDWIGYTPVISGFSGFTPASNPCYYRRQGADAYIRCNFTSVGTVSATVLQIGIPSGLTTASTIAANTLSGGWSSNISNTYFGTVLSQPSVSYINFSISSSGIVGLTPQNANAAISNSSIMSFTTGPIPISGWASNTATFSVANANYDWTSYTPTVTGLGTITGSSFKYRRVGGDLEVTGTFTSGTPTAVLGSFTLPAGLALDANRITIANTTASQGQSVGNFSGSTAAYHAANIVTATGTSTALVYTSNTLNGAGFLTPSNGSSILSASEPASVYFKVPISGWSNVSTVVASLGGVPTVPGLSTPVDTFSVSYGTTNAATNCTSSPCSYLGQIGNVVSSITRSSTGAYSLNVSKTYSKLACTQSMVCSGIGPGVTVSPIWCTGSCSSASFQSVNSVNGAVCDSYGVLNCVGY